MGYSADKTKHTGSYFLDTTSKKPFCGEHSAEVFLKTRLSNKLEFIQSNIRILHSRMGTTCYNKHLRAYQASDVFQSRTKIRSKHFADQDSGLSYFLNESFLLVKGYLAINVVL